jgi:photosystem II stability/assembly factor-like uncharacterized protein
VFAFVSGVFRRQAVAFAATLFLACVAVASARAGTWTTHGPYGGNTQIRVVDPVTPATIYAASSASNFYGSVGGGVFKSVDRGAHWVRATTGLTDPFCLTLAMDPSDHKTLYAAGGNGVFKSVDGAGHWTEISTLVNVNQIVIDPKTPTILYAVISGDPVQKSVDGGKNWVSIYSELPTTSVYFFAIDPKTPSNLYAGADGGLYKSTDGGTKWNLITNGLGTDFIEVTKLWIDPKTPSILYAQTGQGVAKSIDSGVKWTSLTTPSDLFNFEAVDPEQPDNLYGYAWPDTPYISRDAGKTWSQLGNVPASALGLIYTLVVDPTESANLYAGLDQGVFASGNQGKTWTESNEGLSNTAVTALALDPKSPGTLYAGTQSSGIFKTLNGGKSWTREYFTTENGSFGYASSLLIDPAAPTTLYFGDFYGGGVFKTTNAGAAWTNILPDVGPIFSMAIDPQTPTILFTGLNRGVYKTTNAGKSWTLETKGLPVSSLFQPTSLSGYGSFVLATDPSNGVFISQNGGKSWTADDPTVPSDSTVTNAPKATPASTQAAYVFLDSKTNYFKLLLGVYDGNSYDPNVIGFWADRLRVYSGEAAGQQAGTGFAWKPWAAPTGVDAADCPPMTALANDPVTPTTFYAGGVCGVLKGTNSGKQLAAMNAGLPVNVPIFALAITPTANILYAGTFGGGVYSFTNP